MRFQLLGPLALADGPDTVVLQPSKPANLLAALLLHANSPVSAEYLQRAVWGEEQPATARAALQTCVLRLRRLFSKHGVTTSIEAVPGGYRITAAPPTLDLLGFRDRVRRAAGLDRDPEAELCALRDALSLWQGSLLANVRSVVLHRDEVPRLAEERLRAVERVCDLLLGLGRCGEALVDLWTATRVHPGHERFHEQLIEALYRCGRQSQALAEYRRVKGFLLEELGVDPSPSLRRLELAVLRGEDLGPAGPAAPRVIRGETVPLPAARPALAPDAAPSTAPDAASATAQATASVTPQGASPVVAVSGTPAPAEGGPPVQGTTPVAAPPPALAAGTTFAPVAASRIEPVPAVPHFTGRAAETAALTARLTAPPPPGPEDHRPLTVLVSGAPGIGKSALAQHAARLVRDAFPAGQLLVRMTRADGEPRPADEVAADVAAALGASGDGRALLILDDVVDADQVRPLLAPKGEAGAGPGPAVVVTSRMGLGGLIATHGGWVQRLTTFTEAESYALLLTALGAERVEAEPRAAHRLAAVCGHFPAALRILTARLLTRPGLRLSDAADWLGDDPLARLTLTDSPDHSVTGLFDRALGRLDPRLSEAFTHLAQGPPTLLDDQGPQDEGPVPEAVREQLADAGLLEDGPPGPYRIHDLLRAHVRRTARIRDRRTEKV
ncbi:BTAD domain-containing putative transcriptional regulator [Streptomyces globisporus]|uniref:AfsR/SARP family transcriptional regulator n=1 Tax=Streptomyces TaxID=1883 RepID=UPI0004CAEF9D|nr:MULTISPECIES: AfsR/SARP family transcriptional regulator [Streptomyces]PPA41874.1 AfsR family transcriptional regulator [Streptomyces griseus]RAN19185.1 AfsR family transcriptional regulator [Streptomyces badius]AWL88001.1 AfsR family transcriptional regulator [Streptomyces globisporus]RAN27095.1 AfsR family transcriptional regulator [Streptomyces badius]WSF78574.1 winged helix-turn-helix domain-containing protein [Streptomyces globisporus]